MVGDNLFDRPHAVRFGLAETLEIQTLNELRERRLPQFLRVIILPPELFRIEAEFSGHLNMGMRQPVTLSGLDPRFELQWNPWLLCQSGTPFEVAVGLRGQPTRARRDPQSLRQAAPPSPALRL